MVRVLRVESFYALLRDAASASSFSPLLIFPSASDADSLCALRIITHILSSDSIRYSVYPVSSFGDIENFAGLNIHSSRERLSLLLINWGCHRDLHRILKLSSEVRVFVIDSHRPIHLHNLSRQNEQIIVLYTEDDEHHADLIYDFDVSALANASDLNSDDEIGEDSDSDDDSENEVDEENVKRRRLSEESVSDPVRLYGKLKSEYYKLGTFYGKPAGCLMFDLAHSLRKNTNEQLWLACVSLTDQFVHERLTNERYQAGVMELEQYINISGNLETITSVTLKDGTQIQAPENSRIFYEDEPRLMLLREWNLFDSMLCSSYTATKLKTWSDNGLKKLKLLLARMGFSLVDCQKKFQYMSMEVKQRMKDEFDHFLPEYGLTEFYYRSFLRIHGYCSKFSAADVVYGVTALLESLVGTRKDTSVGEQFWVAYSALSLNNLDQLRKGMQNAIEIQRAILRQGSSAMTKSGFIRSGRRFRWVKLEDPVDTERLHYPQALTKFCYFLMDALKERGAKMKPLICACLAKEPGKVLIVGVCSKPRLGAIQGYVEDEHPP
ncbi:cell division control protein 45 homolog isoform X2 [Phalaenopsis equestris]|uniref:cell division control protein 45 homolog isoform X2 n=1 Tax=Phalaenopsis equestris TaxID=78828 RepID=UPI0009E4A85B|nr:cell division control protein 45 homolog isoform X2 [Phalaenopsis equestris]XP_020584352.1 cell division control protein 45 homolog isoform X2 [Phalaenopsis equestris]XP_020584353.1 cell division control protein 45 homolog isoform X2 [Phalaenopsis equestris]